MDIRRGAIMLGIAVVSYLLVLQWQDDFKKPLPVAANHQLPIQQTDAPVATKQSISSENDAPQVVNEASIEISDEVSNLISQTISIKTDVLDIQVNGLGGDISYLALPKYPATIETPDVPFVLLENTAQRTYLSQSGLIGKHGPDAKSRAQYTASSDQFIMGDGQNSLNVDLKLTTADGVNIIKRYSLERGSYAVKLTYIIDNQSTMQWKSNFYAQIKRDATGDPSKSSSMGMQSYLGAAFTENNEKYLKLDFSDIEDSAYKNSRQGGWVAFLQHYFVTAWIPETNTEHHYSARKVGSNYLSGFYDNSMLIEPGDTSSVSATFYAGPKSQYELENLAPYLELTIDYGWLWWVAQPLFWVLNQLHDVLGNWGWSIIFLTLLIKLAFSPLSAASYRSMANMRRVAPQLASLKERHGDDSQAMSKDMMALYKKEKINPLGGCLPIVIQMPVFIALYWVLFESVELRQAPWLGWIQDLSIQDPYFILPIIMGASMFVQMSLNPTPPDPMQARVMKLMPVIFSVFFLFFPAGLVLYWVVNNLLSISQQFYITKKIEKLHADKDS